jgi:hypothetical protein
LQTVRALFKWWDELMTKFQGRRATIFGLDLNDMLGLVKQGRQWVPAEGGQVGSYSLGRQGEAANMLLQFMSTFICCQIRLRRNI